MRSQRLMRGLIVLFLCWASESSIADDSNQIFAADVSSDESLMAVGHEDGSIDIIELKTQSPLRTLRPTTALIDQIKFVPGNNRTLAVINSRYSGTVYFLDTRTGKEVWRIKAPTSIMDLGFSADGKVLAVGCYDGTIDLWDMKKKAHVRQQRQRVPVDSVALSRDGGFLLTGGEDSTLRLWSVRDGQLVWKERAHQAMVNSVAFSIRGDIFLSAANNGEIGIWRTGDHSELVSLKSEGYGANVAFSKSGDFILIGVSGEIIEWRAKRTVQLPDYPDLADSSMLFEINGGTAFAATRSDGVRYWDAATLAPFSTHVEKASPNRLDRDPLGPTVGK